MNAAVACIAIAALITVADAVATIRADRASRRRVWAALDRKLEQRLAGTP